MSLSARSSETNSKDSNRLQILLKRMKEDYIKTAC